MILAAAIFRYFGWGDVLFLSLLGFFLGLATKLDLRGRYFAVAAAQRSEMFRPLRLPVLPICMLGALTFPIIEIVTHWNVGFRSEHTTYIFYMAGSALSVGAWLMIASRLLSADDRRKNGEIREFLSYAESPVPAARHRDEVSPGWLRLWHWLNVAAFAAVLLFALREFFQRSTAR